MIQLKKYGKLLLLTFAIFVAALNCGTALASVQEPEDTVESGSLLQPQNDNRTTWEITGENRSALIINACVRVTPHSYTPGFRKFTSKNGEAHSKAENTKTAFRKSVRPGNILITGQNFDKVKEYYVYFLEKLII